jgi:lysophospholipase L1-like esterase
MSDAVNLICFGDSITQASGVADCERWTAVLQHLLEAWRPGTFRLFNRGIGGHTAVQGFDRLGNDVLPLLPGLVLMEFGFNDAHILPHARIPRVSLDEFSAKMREMHRIIEERGGRVVLIINHTQDSTLVQGDGRSYTEGYLPYDTAIRALAVELNVPAIDLPTMMAERDVDLGAFLTEDGIHLTAAGNAEYADMVYTALRPVLAQEYAKV